jgi:hypothetical protein
MHRSLGRCLSLPTRRVLGHFYLGEKNLPVAIGGDHHNAVGDGGGEWGGRPPLIDPGKVVEVIGARQNLARQ